MSRKKIGNDLRMTRPELERRVDEKTVKLLTQRTSLLEEEIERRKNYEAELKETGEKILREVLRRKHLEKKMITLLERDRQEIGRTLHDEVGQLLAGIHMELDLLRLAPDKSREEIMNGLEKIRERLKDTGKQIRDISRWLRSDILERLGLESAIKDLAQTLEHDPGIRTHLRISGLRKKLNRDMELAVFRIIQEAITNIIKHASAKNVFVNVGRKGEFISIAVEDDGTGFEYDEQADGGKGPRGLGLTIMHERAAQVGGRLWIESAAGKGTQVFAEIPVG